MSADNYHYVLRYPNEKFAILRNLSASVEYSTRELWEADPFYQNRDLNKVLREAMKLNRDEPTEYGVVTAREVDEVL